MRTARHANNRSMPARSTLLASGVSCPAQAGAYVGTPSSAALTMGGDMDLRIKLELDDWSGAAEPVVMMRASSFLFQVAASVGGRPYLRWTPDGTNYVSGLAGFSFGASGVKWLRAALDVDDGAGGWVLRYYTSDDGETWTQAGTDVTGAGVTSVYNSGTEFTVGGYSGVGMGGTLYRAQMLDGIDGTVVADFDATRSLLRQRTMRGSTGELWTLNGATALV
jgi:hypothetical protein